MSHLSDAWKRFWDLDRPVTPTAPDALAVVQSTGVSAHLEEFETEEPAREVTDLDVEHTRIRLCLTPDQDADAFVTSFNGANLDHGRLQPSGGIFKIYI